MFCGPNWNILHRINDRMVFFIIHYKLKKLETEKMQKSSWVYISYLLNLLEKN
jgi:hypothetical protein